MTEPAAVALHAVRRPGPVAGQVVAIFGAGPIGLMAAQWARALGASQVLVFDIVPEKIALAQALGFNATFDSRDTPPVRMIEESTGGEGAHVTIDAAGAPPAFLQALAATRRSGRMVILGNPAADVTLEACRLLGVEAPPETPLDLDALTPAARRFWAESKRVSNARAKAALGWRPAHPTYREELAGAGLGRDAASIRAGTSDALAAMRPAAETTFNNFLDLAGRPARRVDLRSRHGME